MLKFNDRKLSIISHAAMGIGIIILLIVAAFYDLKINQAMSSPSSVFAQLFATLGEFPAYMILPIVGTILFYADWRVKKPYDILIKLTFALIVYAGFAVWGLVGEMELPSKGVTLIYAAILTLGALFVGNMMDRQLATRLVKWCLFAVCVLAVSFILIRLLKMCWGRVRYRDLVVMGNTDAFTPWYLPQGWGSANNSFPSGHTTSACNIFVFVVLFDYSKKYFRFRYLAYALGTLFVLLTALSRIVADAHYLSDVVVGGAVSYGIYYFFKTIFFKNKQFELNISRNKQFAEEQNEQKE